MAGVDRITLIAAAVLVAALALFSFERFLWRVFLQLRVRFRWFPFGRFILFVCPEGHPQRTYVERGILPGLGARAVYHVLSGARTRLADTDDRFAAALAKWFMEPDRDGPVAIVFKPGYEYERVDFSDALAALEAGSDKLAVSKTERLLRLADTVEEKIRVFI